MEKETKPLWWKPAIEAGTPVCPCCPTAQLLHLETVLCNGFGGWTVNKDGSTYYQAETNQDFDECKTLQDIEKEIPEGDQSEWIAHLWAPLREAKYQRHEKNKWVLIQKGEGFA